MGRGQRRYLTDANIETPGFFNRNELDLILLAVQSWLDENIQRESAHTPTKTRAMRALKKRVQTFLAPQRARRGEELP
jgi:hypothetical protein